MPTPITDNFLDCLHFVLNIEKGYVDNPDDLGKATNLGITIGLLSEYRGQLCTNDDVKNLKVSEALDIYRSIFWLPCQCDKMPKAIALVVFDAAVNSGQGRSIKWLQTALGVHPDGEVGAITLGRLAVMDLKTVIEEATNDRLEFMQKCLSWDEFKNGWQDRIKSVQDLATTWLSQPVQN